MCLAMYGYFILAVLIRLAVCDECEEATTCRDKLDPLVSQRLEDRYGLVDVKVADLTNYTLREYIARAAVDVACNTSSSDNSTDCIIANLKNCTSLLQDTDFSSVPIGHIFSEQWEIFNYSNGACDAFNKGLCDVLGTKFKECYGNTMGDVIITGQGVNYKDICKVKTNNYAGLTCMIGILREGCLSVLEDDVFHATFVDLVVSYYWPSFPNGATLCGCYDGLECWTPIKTSIKTYRRDVVTWKLRYQLDLNLGEYLCKNQENVQCSKSAAENSYCNTLFTEFRDNKDLINSAYLIESRICDVFASEAYTANKECIVDRLVNNFQPCLAKENLPLDITTCSHLKSIYRCLVFSLRGECGGDYEKALFELLRSDTNTIEDCTVYTSGAPSTIGQIYASSIYMLYGLGLLVRCLVKH